jgi:hypothetical protein
MGERSGVGLVECAILEALDSLGAQPGRPYRRNARVLPAVEDRIGLAPGYAYEVLLARPWTMPLSLIQGHGNFGSRGSDPAANPPYTESRLSAAGQVARRRAETSRQYHRAYQRQRLPAGTRPPFRPRQSRPAPGQQRPRVTSKDLTDVIGPPYFLKRLHRHRRLRHACRGPPNGPSGWRPASASATITATS